MADPKRFYHAITGSTVVLPSGRTLAFFGGFYDVEENDKEALEQLNSLADKPGTMIVSYKAKVAMDKAFNVAAEQVIAQAAKVAQDIGRQSQQ